MVPYQALKIIKKWEGLRLTAYICPAGKWTIGYGNTYIFGRPVRKGDKLTPFQAEDFLTKTCMGIEAEIKKRIPVKLTEHQLAALISFTYNLGSGWMTKSRMKTKLLKGDYKGASEEFKYWIYANGKPLKGLINRREEERKLFLGYDV